jgi:adenosylmethionine-8-amino-7-oxononanoate aminotransferase
LVNEIAFKQNVNRISEQHFLFKERIQNNNKVKEVRHLGTIIAVEIFQENADYFSSIRDQAYEFFLSIGLLIRPLGNVIFLNPPYCTTNEELERMYDGIVSFVKSL